MILQAITEWCCTHPLVLIFAAAVGLGLLAAAKK